MVELSDEQKAEMLERASRPSGMEQAAAQAGALAPSTEPPTVYNPAADQERVNAETKVIQETETKRQRGRPRKVAAKPTTAASRRGIVEEWGPYDDYQIVTTSYGQFAVPKGEIMHFEQTQAFSNRARGMITVHVPRYRDAKTGLTRDPISGNYYDPELTQSAEEVSVDGAWG